MSNSSNSASSIYSSRPGGFTSDGDDISPVNYPTLTSWQQPSKCFHEESSIIQWWLACTRSRVHESSEDPPEATASGGTYGSAGCRAFLWSCPSSWCRPSRRKNSAKKKRRDCEFAARKKMKSDLKQNNNFLWAETTFANVERNSEIRTLLWWHRCQVISKHLARHCRATDCRVLLAILEAARRLQQAASHKPPFFISFFFLLSTGELLNGCVARRLLTTAILEMDWSC